MLLQKEINKMKKITNTQFNETYYEDTCDNGLHVIVWHKPDFATTSCLFGTPYGSLDIQQKKKDGSILKSPAGVAHFLEHKLFESQEGDIMLEFSNLGASVNAFTSFRETVYYFNTTNQDIQKPLLLLLDFVQDLHVSKESVEKEKGIICQELDMYLENPDSRVFFETLKSLYHTHPLRIDIGGFSESVNSTTKEDLELCHQLNYHPKNMQLIIVTPADPEKIIHLVKDNQSKKSFLPFSPVERHLDEEPFNVYEKEKKIFMNVQQSKFCFGVKLPQSNLSSHDLVKKEWCLRFILEAHLSSMNPDYQIWLDEQQISYYFGFDESLAKDASFLLFFDEGDHFDSFKQFLLSQWAVIKDKNISDTQLTQLKNRSFGETLNLFNNPSKITVNHFRFMHEGISVFELLNIIQEITIEDCEEAIAEIDFSNFCEIVIEPKS